MCNDNATATASAEEAAVPILDRPFDRMSGLLQIFTLALTPNTVLQGISSSFETQVDQFCHVLYEFR
jgi:hypothetical protein